EMARRPAVPAPRASPGPARCAGSAAAPGRRAAHRRGDQRGPARHLAPGRALPACSGVPAGSRRGAGARQPGRHDRAEAGLGLAVQARARSAALKAAAGRVATAFAVLFGVGAIGLGVVLIFTSLLPLSGAGAAVDHASRPAGDADVTRPDSGSLIRALCPRPVLLNLTYHPSFSIRYIPVILVILDCIRYHVRRTILLPDGCGSCLRYQFPRTTGGTRISPGWTATR